MVSFVEVNEKVRRANDVACSADEVGECEKSDDFLSSRAHVLQGKESDHYEDGAKAGEPAGYNGHVAGNGSILNTDV